MSYSSKKTEGCPCCEERVSRHGGFTFLRKGRAGAGDACVSCVLPAFSYSGDKPAFVWPRCDEDVQEAIRLVEEEFRHVMDAVAGVPEDKLTYDNVILPLVHNPCYKTNPLVCQAKHMQHCSPDPDIRASADKATSVFASLKKQSRLRRDVYAVVKRYSETPECAGLEAYRRHFVGAIMGGFERNGLGLSDEENARLKQLLDRDVDVCNDYKKNLAEDKTKITLTVQELAGCPEDWIREKTSASTANGEAANTVVLTLKYPDVLPVLQNCEVQESRKKVALARETAYGNNLDLMVEGANLRLSAAQLLGYKTWSQFITAGRMTGSPEVVMGFLEGIRAKVKDGAQRDKDKLTELKKQHLIERGEWKEGDPSPSLYAWDVSFYHTLLLKREYGVDHEVIRKYFPCSAVVEATLSIYQDLLGLKFTELFDFDTWHPDVRLFAVYDGEGSGPEQRQIGHFYLDLHPRDGKYNHAAIFHLQKRNDFYGSKGCSFAGASASGAGGKSGLTPVDCMLTNLPCPGEDGSPALLRHADVVTFFHEFGHIMHGLLAVGSGNSTTLAKCPRDFVEAPSQMLENWCFDAKVLRRLSKHIETGECLPQEQIDKLLAAKNVCEGLMLSRQIYLATLDMRLHGEEPPKTVEALQALVDRLREEISLIPNPPNCNMLRNFGHLMNQYSAAYHGYLWSEILSADMFASKFAQDPFSKVAGREYRDKVLGVGGVGGIQGHLEAFLGHAPKQEPFLKGRGII